jgi:excisionase family DNA binding protein
VSQSTVTLAPAVSGQPTPSLPSANQFESLAGGTHTPPTAVRISVKEIAERLGIGRISVYGMLEQKIIPGIRFGRRWIVTRFAYEQWEKTCGVHRNVAEGTIH